MTHGTSAHGGSLSRRWTDTGRYRGELGWWIDWQKAAGQAAPLQLLAVSAVAGLALGLVLTTAWAAATDAAQLAALLAAGAATVLVALRRRERSRPAPAEDRRAPEEPSRLLAQMHHELRTPLNAMLGFSEAMLRELHGPLGHARYQEYAAHISESGGRLLKASEDALAVAASMSTLLADRRTLRRERLPVTALLDDAWAAMGTPFRDVRLGAAECDGVEIECDWQATGQALQHLLAEAIAWAGPGGAVTARSEHRAGARRIEIAAEPCKSTDRRLHGAHGCTRAGDCLRLMLARCLLEMQGAALNLCVSAGAERWSACIVFPLGSSRPVRRPARRLSVAARWPASAARRGDFAAAPSAAPRASSQSLAAPPA